MGRRKKHETVISTAQTKRERDRDRKRVARKKIKQNAEAHAAEKAKERQRWAARKKQGKIKTVANMSERERRRKRKTVRKAVQQHRQRQKNMEVQEGQEGLSKTAKMTKRRVRRQKAKVRRENDKLKTENAKLKTQLNKYKKRYARAEKNKKKDIENPITRTVDNFLGGRKVDQDIRDKLALHEAMVLELKEKYSTPSYKEKQAVRKIACGKIVKKYCKIKQLVNVVPHRTIFSSKKVEKKLPSSFFKYVRNVNVTHTSYLRNSVVEFFEDDQNSRMCPGKKDCITRKGVKKQKRYLNASLKDLHRKFITSSSFKISYSSFRALRPFWVVQPKITERDTCLCSTHENMRLLIQTMHSLRIISESSIEDIVSSVCCPDKTEACLRRSCPKCKDKSGQFEIQENEVEVSYHSWVTKKEKRVCSRTKKEITVQRTVKERFHATAGEIVTLFQEKLGPFLQHVFRIEHQYSVINALKKNLSATEALLHIDFSENYACKYSSELQSVHFGASREQITLHTGVFYTKNYHKGFASVSPSLRHDPPGIIAHLMSILAVLLSQFPAVETLHFLSDSPSTQYRNKTMFSLLPKYLSQQFPKIKLISYNYSESGHGKGAADGIGAVLKRQADSSVAYGNDIHDFQSFYENVKQGSKNILISAVYDADIKKIDDFLEPTQQTFKGTMKVHQFTWSKETPNLLHFNEVSCYACALGTECIHYNLGKLLLEKERPFQDHRRKTTKKAKEKIEELPDKGRKGCKRIRVDNKPTVESCEKRRITRNSHKKTTKN